MGNGDDSPVLHFNGAKEDIDRPAGFVRSKFIHDECLQRDGFARKLPKEVTGFGACAMFSAKADSKGRWQVDMRGIFSIILDFYPLGGYIQ